MDRSSFFLIDSLLASPNLISAVCLTGSGTISIYTASGVKESKPRTRVLTERYNNGQQWMVSHGRQVIHTATLCQVTLEYWLIMGEQVLDISTLATDQPVESTLKFIFKCLQVKKSSETFQATFREMSNNLWIAQ